MIKILIPIIFFVNSIYAQKYYSLEQHISSVTMKLNGDIKIFQSTSNPNIYVSTISKSGNIDSLSINTSTASIYRINVSSVICFNGSCYSNIYIPDNLGNHIATTTLNLNNNNLINAYNIYSNNLVSTKTFLTDYVFGIQEYGFNFSNYNDCQIIQNMSGNASISNCNNMSYDNDLPASFYGDYGDYFSISLSSFNFNIPVNASIKGIEVKLRGKTSDNSNPPAFSDCYLLKNGSNYGADKCSLEYFFTSTTTYTEYTLGSATDLWGGVWTSTDINNNGFGFYSLFTTRLNLKYLYIDYVSIKVYYTLPYWEISYDSYNNLNIKDDNNNLLSISTEGYISSKYGILLTSNTDTMGNHIATMTITASYGINTSTIQTKNILVYDPSSQPYINILSMNYLNSPEIRFSTIATNSSWAIGNINTWGDALVFRQKGSNEKMILTQEGKLSIGTNPTPTEKLEVSGNVKADSFINTTQGTTNYIVVSTAIYALNGGGGGGSGGYTSFVIDDFSSQTNGSQKQFTLSQQPLDNSLQLSKNGLVLKSTDDYTLSGQVITMVTAPSSNTALMAQYAVGISTTEKQLLVSTNSWSGRNTFNNNTIYNSSITINANATQQYALTIDSNTNSSDGYIVSITTSGGITSVYSDIGYKVIVSSQISARQNSITISGFNIKRGQKCRLYFDIGNVSGSGAYVRIFLNGDTTLTNYWTQEGAFSGTALGVARSNAPNIGYAGNLYNSEGYCDLSWAKRTGYYTWFCQSRRDDTIALQELLYIGTSNNTNSSPISNIQIKLDNNGNFEGGSYLELMCIGDWR